MTKKTDIQNIYESLPSLLLPWFSKNKRALPWRENKNPYYVWISEIMLQQTRVEAVRNYFLRFIAAFPTVSALANADTDTVLKLWEGLGYYSRARNLHKAAQKIASDFSGHFPETYGEILSLPGVGEYTAGAVSSISFEAPTPAVDGNVLRVASRITNSDLPIDRPDVKKDITENLRRVYPEGACGDFTQSLMELGAMVCIPKSPRCEMCPLQAVCLSYKAGTAASLPKKSPKKERRIEEKTVFFLTLGDSIAIKKRKSTGLLAGLFELPNTEGHLSPHAAIRFLESLGVAPEAPTREARRVHIFTHVEWHMVCYHIPVKHATDAFIWANRAALTTEYALPTAFRLFLED